MNTEILHKCEIRDIDELLVSLYRDSIRKAEEVTEPNRQTRASLAMLRADLAKLLQNGKQRDGA